MSARNWHCPIWLVPCRISKVDVSGAVRILVQTEETGTVAPKERRCPNSDCQTSAIIAIQNTAVTKMAIRDHMKSTRRDDQRVAGPNAPGIDGGVGGKNGLDRHAIASGDLIHRFAGTYSMSARWRSGCSSARAGGRDVAAFRHGGVRTQDGT